MARFFSKDLIEIIVEDVREQGNFSYSRVQSILSIPYHRAKEIKRELIKDMKSTVKRLGLK